MRLLLFVVLSPLVGLMMCGHAVQQITARTPPAPTPAPIVVVPSGPAVPVAPVAAPVPTAAAGPVSDRIQQAIQVAQSWLSPHVPYLWGGCTRRGVDCSCFVQNVYASIGISVQRTTVTQIAFDSPVSRDQLRPGDTVFFDNTCQDCGANPTHEGFYIGNGQMIEAGDPVQVASVFSGFYGAHYHGAGRPPGL